MQKKKFQKLCLMVGIVGIMFVQACNDDVVEPTNPSYLLQGQSIQWDEEKIDSVTLDPALSGLPADEKKAYINRQVSKYHVTVTVPDTNIKQFRIEKVLTHIADRDTTVPEDMQIWKTITYGTTLTEYNKSGAVIQTVSLPISDTVDISSMPLMHVVDSTVTDSVRTLFINMMTSAGQSVTNNGAAGITSQSTFSEDGISYTATAIFNTDYLAMQSSTLLNNGILWSQSNYSYSVVGSFRIATQIVTISPMNLGATEQADMQDKFPTLNFTGYFHYQMVNILNISNITLP